MKTYYIKTLISCSLAAALPLFYCSPANAAPINYGDFSGTTVMYLDVTETANTPGDTEPLYGTPTVNDDRLVFAPTDFTAEPGAASADLTDGQLNFTLMASPGTVIDSIAVAEGGTYTLVGAGTSATLIHYALSMGAVTVMEVDGVPLPTPVSLASMSASGGDDLSQGLDVSTRWDLSLLYDVDSALTAAAVPFVSGATKLEVVIDNFLVAIQEPGALASVTKFDFELDIETRPFIPEPTSMVLLAGLALCVGATRRQR